VVKVEMPSQKREKISPMVSSTTCYQRRFLKKVKKEVGTLENKARVKRSYTSS